MHLPRISPVEPWAKCAKPDSHKSAGKHAVPWCLQCNFAHGFDKLLMRASQNIHSERWGRAGDLAKCVTVTMLQDLEFVVSNKATACSTSDHVIIREDGEDKSCKVGCWRACDSWTAQGDAGDQLRRKTGTKSLGAGGPRVRFRGNSERSLNGGGGHDALSHAACGTLENARCTSQVDRRCISNVLLGGCREPGGLKFYGLGEL